MRSLNRVSHGRWIDLGLRRGDDDAETLAPSLRQTSAIFAPIMTRSRRRISWLVLVALLFTQFATAAYACVGQTSRGAGCDGVHHDATSLTEAASPATMDPAQPTLCAEHCGRDAKAQLDTHAPPALLPPGLAVLLFVLLPEAREALPHAATAPGMERSHAPPVPIFLGRFLS